MRGHPDNYPEDDSDGYYHDDVVQEQPIGRVRSFNSPAFYFSFIALGVYLFFNGTFAANISLNNGQRSEFGQGIQILTACSGSNAITVIPQSTFTNSSGSGAFYLSSVRLNNIPTTCYGNQFTLKTFDSSSSSPLNIFGNNQSEAKFLDDSGNFVALTGSNGLTLTTNSTTSVTITFDTPIATSTNAVKITLESAPYSAITSSTCSSYLGSATNTSITVSGGTCIVSFTAGTNTFIAPTGVNSISVLVVGGGGGGGGGAFGGGGGAGGYVYNAAFNTTPNSTYSITVGNGGTGGGNTLGTATGYTDNSGANGADSIFGSLTAVGGGGGGGYTTTYKDYHTVASGGSIPAFSATKLSNAGIDSSKGKSGGSGGGSSENTYWRGGATTNQGNIGGTPLLSGNILNLESAGGAGNQNQTIIASGGGGGGAGGSGGDVSVNYVAGNGGVGLQNSITGSSVYYAGGGGGGGTSSGGSAGSGGSGGGGAGNRLNNGSAGTANTGGGGGGAGFDGTVRSGGSGGSGVVIIRFNP
jgi:hypothetical protein